MKKEKPFDPIRWALDHARDDFPDLQKENEHLRVELRRALKLDDRPKVKRIAPSYRPHTGKHRRYVIVPDTQVRPGVPTDHLEWAGRYIAEKRPDVVVHLGDHWDLPSLNTHTSDAAKAFSGVDYAADIAAGNEAIGRLVAPFRDVAGYRPELHFLVGNHEDRAARTVENFPFLRGVIKPSDMQLDDWNVHPFLKTVLLDGILFAHYFANPMSGRPVGGTAHNLLRQVGRSCVMGHRQVLDCAIQELPDGTRRRATICGAFYSHREEYKGEQGNGHFRGIIVLNEVRDGMWDQMEVSLEYLRRKYGVTPPRTARSSPAR